MEQSEVKKPESAKHKALGIFGALIAIAIGRYSGANLLFPLAATALVWWGGKKLLNDAKLIFLPALSVQAGHLIWLIFGLIYIGKLDANIIDVFVLVAGLTWLVLKPGLGPVLLLGIFQTFSLVINFVLFLDAAVGTIAHQALLIHIIWRILALYLIGQAYFKFRREEKIYSPPEVQLIDSPLLNPTVELFPTSQAKLIVLYFATIGFYSFYWFYKHWKFQEEKLGKNIIPELRAIFYIFYTYSLFELIETVSADKGVTKSANAGVLATIFIIGTIISSILSRFYSRGEAIGIADYAGLLIMGILVWPLYVMQGIANKVNGDPKGKINSSFSIYNYIFIFIGSIIWISIMIEFLQFENGIPT